MSDVTVTSYDAQRILDQIRADFEASLAKDTDWTRGYTLGMLNVVQNYLHADPDACEAVRAIVRESRS